MKQITKEIKDIRDYLHLYLGREAEVINKPDGLAITDHPQIVTIDGTVVDCSSMMYESIKPILRKLSSMTEEEKEKLFDSVFPEGWMTRSINWAGKIDFINYYLNLEAVNNSGLFDQIIRSMDFKHHIKMVNWVRENKFDADELIDSGLALDKENK